MKAMRRLLALLLCAALLLALPCAASAEDGEPFALRIVAEGRETPIRALQDTYAGNYYLSLRDLSAALSGTAKQYRYGWSYSEDDGYRFTVAAGIAADNGSGGAEAAPERSVSYLNLRRNKLFVDGRERKYYSFRVGTDLYLSLTDIELMLDVTVEQAPDGSLIFRTGTPFAPDPDRLREEGYFDMFNGIVLGDADNGEILFSTLSTRSFPIASLSKLMSYLLIMEAVEAGEIRLADRVTISEAAEELSLSVDGIIKMKAGMSVPAEELLDAMLLASSNEAALALAEFTAGSEEAFVARMNEKARELDLRSAVFHTPHGLPVYTRGSAPAKLQNRMTAADCFTLCRYLLAHYPQLTRITARQYAELPTLDYITANSNPLVFNLEGVNGLKTGSTNRAGFCLAVSMPMRVKGESHTIVLVLLGAESVEIRGQAAEILMRWAMENYAD